MIGIGKPPIRRGDKGWNARQYKYRRGAAVFGPQLPATGFWQVTLPLEIIRAYRHIPAPVRGVWSMGSSTSHMAETAVAAGGGWDSFRRYSAGWRFLPTYAVGAGLRHAGLSALLLRHMGATQPGSYSDLGSHGPSSAWHHSAGSRGEPFKAPWYGSSTGSGWGGKSNWPSDIRHVSTDVTDKGWLASYAGVKSEGWGDPFKHVSMERPNRELPDWFPTTGAGLSRVAHWLDGANPRPRRNGSLKGGPGDWDVPRNSLGIGTILLGGLLGGMIGGKSGVIDKGWLAS